MTESSTSFLESYGSQYNVYEGQATGRLMIVNNTAGLTNRASRVNEQFIIRRKIKEINEEIHFLCSISAINGLVCCISIESNTLLGNTCAIVTGIMSIILLGAALYKFYQNDNLNDRLHKLD